MVYKDKALPYKVFYWQGKRSKVVLTTSTAG